MEPQKRIVYEPVSLIREAARGAMKGRMPLLIASSAVFMLCMGLPIVVVEQITGLWDVFDRAIEDYAALLTNNPTIEKINEWAQAYSDKLSFSYATYAFILLVPGPLTLGLSTIWLRVLRHQDAYTDMVFSGFSNFLRAVLLNFLRCLFMALWAILFIIPGIVAYYRYSIAFFLLVDDPTMSPFTALALSRYYMHGNKSNRFLLDLSFIGWFILATVILSLINGSTVSILTNGDTATLFTMQMVSVILSSFIYAPLYAYRGVAAAEFYHRVICKDPRTFTDVLQLPKK